MSVTGIGKQWDNHCTVLERFVTARVKDTAGRWIDGAGYFTLEYNDRPVCFYLGVGDRHGGEKRLRIRM